MFTFPDRSDVDELNTRRREHVWEDDLSWSSRHRDLKEIRVLQETFLFARRFMLHLQKAAVCWYIVNKS